jgi:hypothetical protein
MREWGGICQKGECDFAEIIIRYLDFVLFE